MVKILLNTDYSGKSNLCSKVDRDNLKVSTKTAFFEQTIRFPKQKVIIDRSAGWPRADLVRKVTVIVAF